MNSEFRIVNLEFKKANGAEDQSEKLGAHRSPIVTRPSLLITFHLLLT
jgi:hypothetical protein